MFGIIQIENLGSFRLAYGAAQAAAIRRDLGREAGRAARAYGLRVADIVELPVGLVLGGEPEGVRQAVSEIELRFNALVRLYYRREDRERGYMVIGEDTAPLVAVRGQCVAGDGGDAAVVAALGIGSPS